MLRDCLELAKPRITGLVLTTVIVGFVLGSEGAIDWARLSWALLGIALAAGGANGLNQFLEIKRDGRMRRTRHRPLPSGRLPRRVVGVGALACAVAGPVVVAGRCDGLAGLLTASAVGVYILVYTPLKSRSPSCTLVGAVCGALPPLIGWVAAAGRPSFGAWALATLLFVWQIPHFLALGWMHRRDYARGGFRILPVLDRDGAATCQTVLLYNLALLPIVLAVHLGGLAGLWFFSCSLLLGAGFLWLGIRLYRTRTAKNARHLFVASVVYLPLTLGLMVADRAPRDGLRMYTGQAIRNGLSPPQEGSDRGRSSRTAAGRAKPGMTEIAAVEISSLWKNRP